MKSSSNNKILKKMGDKEAAAYFDEDVFYPRLINKEKEIQDAKKEAVKIIQDAERQAVQSLEKFQQEGIQKGLKEVSPLKEILSSMVQEMKRFKKQAIEELEPLVLDLSLKMCQKIVQTEMKTNREMIREHIRLALESLMDRRQVTIHLNPEDKALMEKFQEEITSHFRDIEKLKLVASSDISPGGCYIQSSLGDIDATIETKFSEISKSVNKEFKLNG